MLFNGIADSEQMAILTKALNDHCLAFGISDESEREMIAVLVMSLFNNGAISAEELKAGLHGVSDRNRRYEQQRHG
jgi:ABC-type amino acid transport system permease subunit